VCDMTPQNQIIREQNVRLRILTPRGVEYWRRHVTKAKAKTVARVFKGRTPRFVLTGDASTASIALPA